MIQQSKDHPGNRLAFILGVMPRSGTNYLQSLLCLHQSCQQSPLPEDYFAECSRHMNDLQRSLEGKWKSSWGKHLDWTTFNVLPWIGHGLANLLIEGSQSDKIVVAKTPSPNGAVSLRKMFPGAKIIYLMRDGRDVAESLARGMGWNVEMSSRKWSEKAAKIRDDVSIQDKNTILVKYEELVMKTDQTLKEIFGFMGLDPEKYNSEEARQLPVRGSSTFARDKSTKLNWNPARKDDSFKPVGQWAGWSQETEQKFWQVAGQLMESFGYHRRKTTINKVKVVEPSTSSTDSRILKGPPILTILKPIAVPRASATLSTPSIEINLNKTHSQVLITVSTCPRADGANYLPGTLEQIEKAGGSGLPGIVMSNGPLSECHWASQINESPKSSRTNLWAAIRLAANSKVERLIFFEDDIELCKNAVTYMASIPIPRDLGMITFHDLKDMPPGSETGLYVMPSKGRIYRGFWGLQAVVIPSWSLTYLATRDPFSILTINKSCNGDQVIGQMLSESKQPKLGVHVPCLANHLGEISVAHPTQGLRPGRIPTNWRGKDFDAASIKRLSVIDLMNVPYPKFAARNTVSR